MSDFNLKSHDPDPCVNAMEEDRLYYFVRGITMAFKTPFLLVPLLDMVALTLRILGEQWSVLELKVKNLQEAGQVQAHLRPYRTVPCERH